MLRRKRLADLPEHWDFGELTPGAQVRVRRSGYYHHGIYIGNGEIVHFDGSPNEQDAAAVRVRRTGMEEFLRGGLPGASHLWPCGAKAAARAGRDRCSRAFCRRPRRL